MVVHCPEVEDCVCASVLALHTAVFCPEVGNYLFHVRVKGRGEKLL